MVRHSFHIPVMGIGFTIDTPLKVSRYGIDSVISLIDDILLEKLRKMYSEKYDIPYNEILYGSDDYRAKRITAYLNLINHLSEIKFAELKNSLPGNGEELDNYINMLPGNAAMKKDYFEKPPHLRKKWIDDNLVMGSIDVNIMTKVDKENYSRNEKLPTEYNDAHAALRGYANSDLKSSLILSAGMNPRLYSYLEKFEDFYPSENGKINKKITLKVSDYRSALIQGKFLARKGLWVSEFRVESGLNCGGHAFATDGFLLGPILSEFRDKRDELTGMMNEIMMQALSAKKRVIPERLLPVKISAQGGVGTAEEHQFLLDHYGIDSVGWGTPFLLVPEATTVDPSTLVQLAEAEEDDLYLSNISPLGVPFNTLKGNTKDIEKLALIAKGRPGSSCPKQYVALGNNEYTGKNICTASRQYQYLKLKEIKGLELSTDEYQDQYEQVVEKSCICVGLGTAALLANGLEARVEGTGVSVCPGPNLAYFSKVMSLKEITDHIYGRFDIISRTDRPHMFIKELRIYINYLKQRIEETKNSFTAQQEKYLLGFTKNLNDGISYYDNLFKSLKQKFEDKKSGILSELESSRMILQDLAEQVKNLLNVPVSL